MSITGSEKTGDLVDRLKTWPSAERLRLARMILETLETGTDEDPPRVRSLKDILGLLKTDSSPPTDEQCREILRHLPHFFFVHF